MGTAVSTVYVDVPFPRQGEAGRGRGSAGGELCLWVGPNVIVCVNDEMNAQETAKHDATMNGQATPPSDPKVYGHVNTKVDAQVNVRVHAP